MKYILIILLFLSCRKPNCVPHGACEDIKDGAMVIGSYEEVYQRCRHKVLYYNECK